MLIRLDIWPGIRLRLDIWPDIRLRLVIWPDIRLRQDIWPDIRLFRIQVRYPAGFLAGYGEVISGIWPDTGYPASGQIPVPDI